MSKLCYFCGEAAKTKEHIPPKCFFPESHRTNLLTVPSCQKHNNQKSGIDQYILSQIAINAAHLSLNAKERFFKVILPQLEISSGFGKKLLGGTIVDEDLLKIKIHIDELDQFMTYLIHGLVFHKYKTRIPKGKVVKHDYPNFLSNDPVNNVSSAALDSVLSIIEELTKPIQVGTNPVIFNYTMIAPLGLDGSVTVKTTFYEYFKVTSLINSYDNDFYEGKKTVVLGKA